MVRIRRVSHAAIVCECERSRFMPSFPLHVNERTFHIEVGPVRASGVPAVLIGVAGIILARGVTSALMQNAPRLPETLGEARGLAEAMTTSGRLRS